VTTGGVVDRMASTLGLEGIEAVFRTVGDQPSLWEPLLLEEVLRLPGGLAPVDALLDDPAFFAPFAAHFDPLIGCPSTPVECYLRLMFLKFRSGWAMRACAPRWPTRSPGGGFAGSRWMGGCRIRRR
jgi:IS5 family transposase